VHPAPMELDCLTLSFDCALGVTFPLERDHVHIEWSRVCDVVEMSPSFLQASSSSESIAMCSAMSPRSPDSSTVSTSANNSRSKHRAQINTGVNF
jgi:hypothetical protein